MRHGGSSFRASCPTTSCPLDLPTAQVRAGLPPGVPGTAYPVRLLPILLFESIWKLIRLADVALPRAAAGDLDAATQDVVVSCLLVVIMAVVPWRYLWQQYVTGQADRWR